ncbi:hypothetical protein AAEX28_06270 [Lentisphaerota bacterium WC36G]|nr:hypothetical protein LJT99_09135 [Lentisphaerae bacterium WC36]
MIIRKFTSNKIFKFIVICVTFFIISLLFPLYTTYESYRYFNSSNGMEQSEQIFLKFFKFTSKETENDYSKALKQYKLAIKNQSLLFMGGKKYYGIYGARLCSSNGQVVYHYKLLVQFFDEYNISKEKRKIITKNIFNLSQKGIKGRELVEYVDNEIKKILMKRETINVKKKAI